MINSIQQFLESGVPNLQKAAKEYADTPTDFAGFVYKVRDEALKLALDYIAEVLNTCDQMVRVRIPLERNSQSAIAVRLSAPNGKFLH